MVGVRTSYGPRFEQDPFWGSSGRQVRVEDEAPVRSSDSFQVDKKGSQQARAGGFVGGDGRMLNVLAPATAEDGRLAAKLIDLIPTILLDHLEERGYTINVSRHSSRHAKPTDIRTFQHEEAAVTPNGIHHAGHPQSSGFGSSHRQGEFDPYIGICTYVEDGALKLDPGSLLRQIGIAYDTVLNVRNGEPLHVRPPFPDAFAAEFKQLPAEFHDQAAFFGESFSRAILDPDRFAAEFPKMSDALRHFGWPIDGRQRSALQRAAHRFVAEQRPKPLGQVRGSQTPDHQVAAWNEANVARLDGGVPPQPLVVTLTGPCDYGSAALAEQMQRSMERTDIFMERPEAEVWELTSECLADPAELKTKLETIVSAERPQVIYVEDLASLQANDQAVEILSQHLTKNGHLTPVVLAGPASDIAKTDTLFPDVLRSEYKMAPLTPAQQIELVSRFGADEGIAVTPPAKAALKKVADAGGYADARRLYKELKQAQSDRVSQTLAPTVKELTRITKGDVESLKTAPKGQAQAKLQSLIGQTPAKAQIDAILATAKVASMRDKHGMDEAQRPRMNLLFSGPPGTGKTTIAQLFIELLADVGYLNEPNLHKATIQDLVGSGSPEQAVKALFEDNKGGAIFVDEMHQLMDTPEGKRAFKAMIPYLGGSDYADTVFIGAGYTDEMRDLIRDVDKGGERRFVDVPFSSFSKKELGQILDLMIKERDLTLTPSAKKAALEYVEYRKRVTKNFGNAGEIERALDEAVKKQTTRLSALPASKVTKQQLRSLNPTDFALPKPVTPKEFWQAFDGLSGLEDVKKELLKIANLIEFNKRRGKPLLDGVEPYFIIEGPPGCGKSTLARLLSKFGAAYGLLALDETVDRAGTDFQARFVGQTGGDVRKHFEDAWGRNLFVDEVSGLAKAGGTFKDEAATVILKQMEDHRGRFMMVVADYPENINQFLQLNPGLPRRFGTRFTLKSWPPEQAAQAFLRQLSAADLNADVLKDAVQGGFQKLAALPGWASGGDVRTMVNNTTQELAAICADADPKANIDDFLPAAFEAAIANLSEQKKALEVTAATSNDDPALYAAQTSAAKKTAKADKPSFDDQDHALMAAMESVDQDFAAYFDAMGPDALQAAQADPKSDYMKAVAEKMGVKPAAAVKQAETVRVKIRALVERKEVKERFEYHCPYCGGIDSGSCAYISMPMDWKVQHSLKKPWTEVTITKEVVEKEV